ncbi:MAG TPA: hypothetical protein VFV53_10200, partial [Candidatus Limnocylindrales bacterium]|nr:hypothetical protein [Candidatus Limnocylindrales bacterium]
TNGRTIVDREQLRALSGDFDGGSTLIHVQRAFAKLGIAMTASPIAGEAITWNELLDRLGQGGGAILLGDYGKLPRKYGRWDPSFWENEGVLDDHALYLDGYDRQRGVILVMDPLAPPGWGGEWMPLKALKQFAWKGRGGTLWTAMTPVARAAPFEGVAFGGPAIAAAATSFSVSWPIALAPEGWTATGTSVSAQFTPALSLDRARVVVTAPPADAMDAASAASADPATPLEGRAAVAPATSSAPAAVPAAPTDPAATTDPVAPSAPASAVVDAALIATIPFPAPGVYDVSVTVTENRFGLDVATAGPFTLYVPGPRAATYVVPDDRTAEPGASMGISVLVRNSGIESWRDASLDPLRRLDMLPPRNTRLVGTWILDAPAKDDERGLPLPPPAIDFGPLPLEPGYLQLVEATIRVPADAGPWRLVLDVVDDEIGSLAGAGSVPAEIVFDVLDAGHIANGP